MSFISPSSFIPWKEWAFLSSLTRPITERAETLIKYIYHRQFTYRSIAYNNYENKHMYRNKIKKILEEITDDTGLRAKIITQVKFDFEHILYETIIRVEKDLKSDAAFRDKFNLPPHTTISCIELADNETHNKGKRVAFISFSNGVKVVYKPRSLLPEQLICGGEESIFHLANLPTYRVHDKQNYGYCEFVKHTPRENVFESADELTIFFKNIALIEQIAKEFLLTDLHCGNVIVANKQPYLIDLEVILDPLQDSSSFQTLLVDDGTLSGSLGFQDGESKNSYSLSPNLQLALSINSRLNLSLTVTRSARLALKIDLETLLGDAKEIWTKKKVETINLPAKIQQATTSLRQSCVRIVPISTSQLNVIIIQPFGIAKLMFYDYLSEKLKEKFTIVEKEVIEDELENDILHNDVPIFYYHPEKQQILYHDKVIAVARKV